MIDLNSTKADGVLMTLFYVAPFLGMITARTIMIAQMKMDGKPIVHGDKLTRFTGNDITIFVMTLICSLIVVVDTLKKASFAYVLDVLTTTRSELSHIGWALTFVWWLHIIAPFAVGLMLSIGRRRRFKRYGHVANEASKFGIYMG